MKNNFLTDKDKKELAFLRKRAKQIQLLPWEIPLEKILDAIESDKAERASINARAAFEEGRIGFLEREQGRKKDGTIFYFARTYTVDGIPYYLDTMFRLELESAYSYKIYNKG